MAKIEKKTLEWMNVDAASIEGDKAYEAYKAAQKVASDKRGVFEQGFIKKARDKGMIKPDETLRFSYRFGQLGVAKDKDDGDKVAKAGTFKL